MYTGQCAWGGMTFFFREASMVCRQWNTRRRSSCEMYPRVEKWLSRSSASTMFPSPYPLCLVRMCLANFARSPAEMGALEIND